jgi:Domain of unknown function (DUF4397)
VSALRRVGALVCLIAVMFLGTHCGNTGSNAQLRALEASPDEATTLNVLLDGNTIFSNIGLGTPTNYTSVASGSRHLQVEPTNSSTPSIDETVTFNPSTNYTLITANFATSLTPILLTDNLTAPASGDFQLRLVNAAPSAGPIDIYVVAPGTAAGSVQATVTSLPFTSATSFQSLTAGSYDVIFTQAGFPGVPYLQLSSVMFEAGQNRTVVLVPDAGGGYTAVTLNDLN